MGLPNLASSLSVEFAPRNVKVNNRRTATIDLEDWERLETKIPLRRTDTNVAIKAVFVLHYEDRWINGHSINVNGEMAPSSWSTHQFRGISPWIRGSVCPWNRVRMISAIASTVLSKQRRARSGVAPRSCWSALAPA